MILFINWKKNNNPKKPWKKLVATISIKCLQQLAITLFNLFKWILSHCFLQDCFKSFTWIAFPG